MNTFYYLEWIGTCYYVFAFGIVVIFGRLRIINACFIVHVLFIIKRQKNKTRFILFKDTLSAVKNS